MMVKGKGRVSTDHILLDAAILFYRDKDDPELKDLALICFNNVTI